MDARSQKELDSFRALKTKNDIDLREKIVLNYVLGKIITAYEQSQWPVRIDFGYLLGVDPDDMLYTKKGADYFKNIRESLPEWTLVISEQPKHHDKHGEIKGTYLYWVVELLYPPK
jgi:hypothetical protein